jgi:hypothetical protein
MEPEAVEVPVRAPLAGGELLLRRFDPDSSGHFDIDQEYPEQPPQLRPKALRFDRTPKNISGLPAQFFGCSVFRRALLDQMGLPYSVVLEPPFVGLAEVSADDARKVGQDQTPNPIDAVEDLITPLWADGSDLYNVSHGLITFSKSLTGTQRDRLATKLCRKMRILWLRPASV